MQQSIYPASECPEQESFAAEIETFKALCQKKEASKPWQTFLAKLDAHQTKPVEDWDHYQLLGYVVANSAIQIRYEGTEPRLHPQMMKMRKLIAFLHDCVALPALYNAGSYSDHRYHPATVKKFIDWALAILAKQKRQLRSLGYLLHQQETEEGIIQRRTWIDAYKEETRAWDELIKESEKTNAIT